MARTGDGGAPEGPDGWPLVGNTLQFARDPFEFYERCGDYGDVVPYTVARQTFYMVTHPDDVERVLATEHGKFGKGQFQRDQLSVVLGQGLLTSEGDRWRDQRQRIQPAFTPEKIRSYVEEMTECTTAAIADWEHGEPLAIDDEMRKITVQVLARSLFGTDIGAHVETISAAMDDVGARSEASTLAALIPPWVPTPWNRRTKRGLAAIDGVIEDLVERRAGDAAGRDDLLSTLLVAHRQGDITRETLRDQLVTFLLAGHETTSLALTYTWYLLAQHDADYREVLDEVDEVVDGAVPTLAAVPALDVTERSIDEAMRRYPPVYRMVRQARETVELGGVTVDAGSRLTLPQWLVHRDERFWEDPERYRPERWTWDVDRPEYAYFPFGGGPRRCIGMEFARLEAQLIVATIAREYELELVGDGGPLDLQPGVTAAPAEPVEMVPLAR
jgi:cytochrome P450